MDLSKLKIDVYDFLGLIIPGLIAVCELRIFVRGWSEAVSSLANLSGTALTILLIISFGVGHLIQELGDLIIKRAKGPRFFKLARDKYWASEESKPVKRAIAEDLGHPVESSDEAFDHCLTNIEGRFSKRDVFLATSDLSRSFLVLSIVGIAPLIRIVAQKSTSWLEMLSFTSLGLGVIVLIFCLSWTRMVRFRELSDITVFRVYLAFRSRHA